MLVHTVYFYLRPDLSADQREFFQREVAKLGDVPTVKSFYLGRPAPVTARPVVDLSFSWSITCVFDDVAQHDIYQEHPVHVAFIERCKSLWARVQVYDAIG
ncbi:MAG TPA: Dabb family protein [Candidatus Synoicihabitans sp.]|nr:Dabb family protein [Candidatus Synoicihabitans sp.]